MAQTNFHVAGGNGSMHKKLAKCLMTNRSNFKLEN